MPQLSEWMLHYPSDWTAPQALAYQRFVLSQLTNAISAPHQALGSSQMTAILLTVVAHIAACNRLAARDICNLLANAYDQIEAMDPLREATVQ